MYFNPIQLPDRSAPILECPPELSDTINNVHETYNDQPRQALKQLNSVLKLVSSKDHPKVKSILLYQKGQAYKRIGDFNNAIKNFNEAIALGDRSHIDKFRNSMFLIGLGVAYFQAKDFKNSLSVFLQASKARIPELEFSYTNNIGVIYYSTERYKEALEYFHKAHEIAKTEKKYHDQVVCMINMSSCHFNLDEYQKGIGWYNLIFDFLEEYDVPDKQKLIARSHANIGIEDLFRKRYKESETRFKKALSIYKKRKNRQEIKHMHHMFTELYLENNNKDKFNEHLDIAMGMAEADEDIDLILELTNCKAKSEIKEGSKENALDTLREHSTLLEKLVKDLRKERFEEVVDLYGNTPELDEAPAETAQHYKALQLNHREKEGFALFVAYNLKRPLANIEDKAKKLAAVLDEAEKESVPLAHSVLETVVKLSNSLESLFEFSKVDSTNVEFEIVDLNEIVKKIIKGFKDSGLYEQSALEVESLPRFITDPKFLTMIYKELIENALVFHSPKSLNRVRVGSELRDGNTWLFVEDNGIGIPKKYQDKVFDLFYQVDDIAYNGNGTGLSLVKKAVELLGGSVILESEYRKGTKVLFTLGKEPVELDELKY